jgi:hypothetical protein
MTSVIGYFERIAVIHLPERKDRMDSITAELARMGVDVASSRVQIPPAPRPADANGFPSRSVYGNFLSHLSILASAREDGVEHVLVLEDDAIFHDALRGPELIPILESSNWDMCYLGHAMPTKGMPAGLVPYELKFGRFKHAHCYAVHKRCLPTLLGYLEATLRNPPGHPEGGRMYIDGAFQLFRQRYVESVTLMASPNLSRQKGCRSSIAANRWYDRPGWIHSGMQAARGVRDGVWKRTPRSIL